MKKITVNIKKEVEVEFLLADAGVRYWEDATVNDAEDESGDLIPCRNGDRWQPKIHIESGRIVNWKQGTTANIHYKICDDGFYHLLDTEGATVITIEGYVPTIMCPEGSGYGDYIIMNVDENGMIENWEVDFEGFENEEE